MMEFCLERIKRDAIGGAFSSSRSLSHENDVAGLFVAEPKASPPNSEAGRTELLCVTPTALIVGEPC